MFPGGGSGASWDKVLDRVLKMGKRKIRLGSYGKRDLT